MKYKYLPIIFAVLLSFSAAMAQDFQVSIDVNPEDFTVGPFEIADYDIKIHNNGFDDTYEVTVEGLPEDWYSLSEERISIPRGSYDVVYLFITPQEIEERTYDFTVSVKGKSYGEETARLRIVPEHNLDVSMPAIFETCICEDDEIIVEIENNGKFDEEVQVTISGDATELLDFRSETFRLEVDTVAEMPLKIKGLCGSEEKDYELVVDVKSKTSYARSSVSSKILKEECFSFDLIYFDEVDACAGYETKTEIEIQNNGLKDDIYRVEIEKFEYSESISLSPGQSKIIEVSILELEPGTYEIPFTVSSTYMDQSGVIKLMAENCYEVDLIIETDEISVVSGTGELTNQVVKNTGTKPDRFELVTDTDWVRVKPRSFELGSGESESVYVYLSPEYGTVGEFNVKIRVYSEKSEDEENIKVNSLEPGADTTTTLRETTTTTMDGETTTRPDIDIPDFDFDIDKILAKLTSFCECKDEKSKKLVLSILIGFLAATVIVILVYLVVMRS